MAKISGFDDITFAFGQDGVKYVADQIANMITGGMPRRKQNPENLNKLTQIDEVDFQRIISVLNAEDLYYVLKIPKMRGKAEFSNQTMDKKDGIVVESLKTNYLLEEVDDVEKNELIRANIEIIDFDYLLLCSAMKYVEKLKRGSIEPEQIEEMQGLLQIIKSNISSNQEAIFRYKDRVEKFSGRALAMAMKGFIVDKQGQTKYVSQEECKRKKEEIIAGQIMLKDLTFKEYGGLGVTGEEELRILKVNPENYIFFLRQEKCKYSKEVILRDIKEIGICSSELFELLCKKTDLTVDEICNLFDQGLITIEDLKMARKTKGVPIIEDKRLLDEYAKYKRQNDNQEERALAEKRFKRYADAYTQTELIGKTSEELEQTGNQFIINNEERIESDDIEALYVFNIIPLNVVIDWTSIEIIKKLLVEEKLKPVDAKYLMEKGLLTENSLKDMFDNNPAMSYIYQLALVAEVFEDDFEAEKRISEHYHIEKGLPTRNSAFDTQEVGEDEEQEGKVDSVSNNATERTKGKPRSPAAKYKLLSAADKDVWIEEGIIDGHIIFHYPNVREGIVAIEKMHKIIKNPRTRKLETRVDNGAATYIMSEEEFGKIKRDLIKDGKVDRRQLTKNWFHKAGYWFMHSVGWEEAIRERLDMNVKNNIMHTTEDIIKIEELVRRCKESCKDKESAR